MVQTSNIATGGNLYEVYADSRGNTKCAQSAVSGPMFGILSSGYFSGFQVFPPFPLVAITTNVSFGFFGKLGYTGTTYTDPWTGNVLGFLDASSGILYSVSPATGYAGNPSSAVFSAPSVLACKQKI